ncbi:MAG: SDR family oxidoreductase [Pseudomonadota bacterium]
MVVLRRVLVTGATAGIGEAIAERLASEGYEVTAVGRRAERLQALARRSGVQPAPGDVTDAARMQQIVAQAQPEILINNAGIGLAISGLDAADAGGIARSVATNVTAPIQITQMVLPAMKAAGRGHIVNVGSIAGLHTLQSALYGAGKAAVHRFSQNLRHELVGTGVRVTELCPGRVESEFYDAKTGNIENNSLSSVGYKALSPLDIADAVLYALSVPDHVNITTLEILPTGQAVGGVKVAEIP